MVRNYLATLLLCQGVPMLSAGDELGRTQRGNNNAYCQDNEISWLDWNLDEGRERLLEFTRSLIHGRLSQPVLMRRGFFQGHHIFDSQLKDVAWFRPDGTEMQQADWQKPVLRTLGFLLGGMPSASWTRRDRSRWGTPCSSSSTPGRARSPSSCRRWSGDATGNGGWTPAMATPLAAGTTRPATW